MSRKIPVLLIVVSLISIVILCALGNWQVQRLAWKQDLLAQIENVYEDEPSPLETTEPLQYLSRYSFSGTLIGDPIIFQAKLYQSGLGVECAYLVRSSDNKTYIVNFGWAAQENLCVIDNDESVYISALYREAIRSNRFINDNEPENNTWYWPDIPAIEKARDINIEDGVLYAEQIFTPHITPKNIKPQLKNDHLQYAIFWYVMAFFLLIIAGIRIKQNMVVKD